jgi:sec-independent protein translocase protein TatB
MFNVGFSELLILGVLGLLILGPEKLPEMAQRLAKMLNELKRVKEEALGPIKDLQNETEKMLAQARREANSFQEAVDKQTENFSLGPTPVPGIHGVDEGLPKLDDGEPKQLGNEIKNGKS